MCFIPLVTKPCVTLRRALLAVFVYNKREIYNSYSGIYSLLMSDFYWKLGTINV